MEKLFLIGAIASFVLDMAKLSQTNLSYFITYWCYPLNALKSPHFLFYPIPHIHLDIHSVSGTRTIEIVPLKSVCILKSVMEQIRYFVEFYFLMHWIANAASPDTLTIWIGYTVSTKKATGVSIGNLFSHRLCYNILIFVTIAFSSYCFQRFIGYCSQRFIGSLHWTFVVALFCRYILLLWKVLWNFKCPPHIPLSFK